MPDSVTDIHPSNQELLKRDCWYLQEGERDFQKEDNPILRQLINLWNESPFKKVKNKRKREIIQLGPCALCSKKHNKI